MCREVLVSEPFNFKRRSPERGKVWDAIAQRLNAIDQPTFRVSARAVRVQSLIATGIHFKPTNQLQICDYKKKKTNKQTEKTVYILVARLLKN